MYFCEEHNIPVLELPQNISYWSVVKYLLYQSCDIVIAKYMYSKMVYDQINNFLFNQQQDKHTKERFFKSLETIVEIQSLYMMRISVVSTLLQDKKILLS